MPRFFIEMKTPFGMQIGIIEAKTEQSALETASKDEGVEVLSLRPVTQMDILVNELWKVEAKTAYDSHDWSYLLAEAIATASKFDPLVITPTGLVRLSELRTVEVQLEDGQTALAYEVAP